ncbi:MAG: DUF4364 family protein, partial [Lachnospiraceae bacterium]|nr:DUF4364 family protein [Lachnospiraceae bacterium]
MEPQVLYKLMILYLLKKVNFPLSNAQLWTFFEQKGYTNYFTFQEVLVSLVETNLITSETIRNEEHYELGKEGDDVLYYFKNDLSESIREDLDRYVSDNKFQLRTETGVVADYYKTEEYEYMAHVKVREGKSTLFEM